MVMTAGSIFLESKLNPSAVKQLVAGLEAVRDVQSKKLEGLYRDKCQSMGIEPAPIQRSAAEQEYGRLVPRNRYKLFTDEARKRSADVNKLLADGPRLQGLAGAEAVAFIDGTRSILDIYDAVRAEYGHVTTSSNEYKFAYVVTPQASDIDLEAVANLIRALEKAGLIEMAKR